MYSLITSLNGQGSYNLLLRSKRRCNTVAGTPLITHCFSDRHAPAEDEVQTMKKFRHSLLFWCALSTALSCGETFAAEHGGEAAASGPVSEYMNLKPAIITNFGGAGPIHFLKAEISLRVGKDPENGLAVQHHIPQIRHTLVMLLARQTDETLGTMQGKEQIRQDALAAVQKVLQDEEGKKLVEDLLFNNLIVQR